MRFGDFYTYLSLTGLISVWSIFGIIATATVSDKTEGFDYSLYNSIVYPTLTSQLTSFRAGIQASKPMLLDLSFFQPSRSLLESCTLSCCLRCIARRFWTDVQIEVQMHSFGGRFNGKTIQKHGDFYQNATQSGLTLHWNECLHGHFTALAR